MVLFGHALFNTVTGAESDPIIQLVTPNALGHATVCGGGERNVTIGI